MTVAVTTISLSFWLFIRYRLPPVSIYPESDSPLYSSCSYIFLVEICEAQSLLMTRTGEGDRTWDWWAHLYVTFGSFCVVTNKFSSLVVHHSTLSLLYGEFEQATKPHVQSPAQVPKQV